jgi:uncharacterized LabA/DUF88 family protein
MSATFPTIREDLGMQPSRAIHRDQRVAIFVDVQNMFYSARNLYQRKLNFEQLLLKITAGRRLTRAITYVVQTPEVDQTSFLNFLMQTGYEVKIKELRKRADGSAKGDWDMGIAIDSISIADKVDVVAIVSGDGDFCDLVRHLKAHGSRYTHFQAQSVKSCVTSPRTLWHWTPMYSCIRRLLPLLALLCGSTAVHAQEKQYLTVRSQGYSRFEIEADNIIAYYTGGVEFTYLGFELRADDLRYNQASGVASVEGTVQFRSAGLNVDAHSLVLDAEQGRVNVTGPLRVLLIQDAGEQDTSAAENPQPAGRRGPLYVEAGSAVAVFPPGSVSPQLDEIDVELTGGILVVDEAGNRLTTSRVIYTGLGGVLNVPEAFELLAQLQPAAATTPPQSPAGPLGLRISGAALSGAYNNKAGIVSAAITQPEITASNGRASASRAQITMTSVELGQSWQVELEGQPVALAFANAGQTYALDAEGVLATIDPTGNMEAQLTGDVNTNYGGATVESRGLTISSRDGTLSIGDASGFRIGFDLSERIDMEPLDLSTLGLGDVTE